MKNDRCRIMVLGLDYKNGCKPTVLNGQLAENVPERALVVLRRRYRAAQSLIDAD